MADFNPGDKINWTSQAAGSAKTKHGKILAFLAGMVDHRHTIAEATKGMPKSRVKINGTESLYDRYLVEVPRMTSKGQSGFDYYAPRVSTVDRDGGSMGR